MRDGFRDGALDMRSGVNAEVILWAIGAGLERSQQAVVTLLRAFDARQRIYALGKVLKLVHEAASRMGLDAFRDSRLAQRGPQLIELFRAGQEREITFPVRRGRSYRVSYLNQQSGNQDVGIEPTRIRLCRILLSTRGRCRS